MTRLEKHRAKIRRRRILIWGGLIVAFIVFASTIGLNVVINASTFVGNLLGGREKIENRSVLIQEVIIDELPEAVNTSTVTVTGSAINFDTLIIILNGEEAATAELGEDGEFEETISGLVPGKNEIYATAEGNGTKKSSDTHVVLYQSEKPKLEISEPTDGETTSNEEIVVKGATDKEVSIKVNSKPVVVDASGQFEAAVRLIEGENKIEVIATDIAGNTQDAILTVKYERE